MEISNARHQVMAAHQLEQVLAGFNCPKNLDPHHQHQQLGQQGQLEKKRVRPPNPEQALKCPRCESSNTKFCYYNNYSLTQPRYFCKGCRRYWTQGGSLRNVPVGGGCRKNKRSSSSSSSSSSKNKPQPLTTANNTSNPVLFPPLSYDPSDLSLAFTSNLDNSTPFLNPNPNPSAAGFLDILRGSGGFQNGYNSANASSYYVDDQACANMLPPFEGANNLAGTTSAAAATAMEGSWVNHGNNAAVDSTRGYWNGGVGSYWHGLINSSLM
ncbi:uncharacterized protein M6B38_153180 [Iris pallida]|uniref:Dof zinc finger protein n=1 Tax=Iris pallida TaxID=29817 RepID=A0AAX6F677_IRIPA|nr:uncharacterized protein M6B38_153180 [Iris pallida]